MMFSAEDFKIDDFGEFLKAAPIFVFIAFVGPFLLAAYSAGAIMGILGWTDSPDNTLGEF